MRTSLALPDPLPLPYETVLTTDSSDTPTALAPLNHAALAVQWRRDYADMRENSRAVQHDDFSSS